MPGVIANHKTSIVDRTLPEIRNSLLKMSRLDILDLCWMLVNVGADMIEADAGLLDKMGKLPDGLVFLLKATDISGLEACSRLKINRCVLRRSLLEQPGAAQWIRREGIQAVLEVRANSIGGIRRLEELKELENFDAVKCVRIAGLGRIDTPEWLETVEYIRDVLGTEIDICPDNRFSMGNAIALEAASSGIRYVTTSFSGFGYDRSYAALEVVLSAMKFQRTGGRKANPDVLPLLCEQFTKCSRVKIAGNRPVLSGNRMKREETGGSYGVVLVRELVDA